MKRLIHKLLFKWFGIEAIKTSANPRCEPLKGGDIINLCSLGLDNVTKQYKILFKKKTNIGNVFYVKEVKNEIQN